MPRAKLLLTALFASIVALPAAAADYYLTSRYMSAADLGEVALAINGDTIRPSSSTNKLVDITSINSVNERVTVFTTEVDCNANAWRVTAQKDYRTDNLMAPQSLPVSAADSAFSAVEKGSQNGKAIEFVCGWPASASGLPAASKVTEAGPVALAKKVAPGLNFRMQNPVRGDD